MSSTVVHVENISPQTTDKEVRDFFSFCGKINSLTVTPASADAGAPKSATVTFEKENAAKTALLLDNTQLGPSQVHVKAGANISEVAASAGQTHPPAAGDDEDIPQDEKPRTRVLAEYLAHGYVISDQAIQHAIALDNKHGFSTKFTGALATFDQKLKASERAREMDKNYGLSERAQTSWRGLHSYFQKAAGTPTGQKIMDFYTQTEKQVRDVHAEARRLADLKAGNQPGNQPTQVPGTDKTTCQCGGNTSNCPCAEGKCSCAGCSKSSATAAAVPEAAAATTQAEGVPKPADTAAAPLSTNNS